MTDPPGRSFGSGQSDEFLRMVAVSARALMRRAQFRWWLVGGTALALGIGRCWRVHSDLDIAAYDDVALRAYRQFLLADGSLRMDGDAHQRIAGSDALRMVVEFQRSAGDDSGWSYRRDPSLRLPWTRAVVTRDGVPCLAPELVLLSKAHRLTTQDTCDAQRSASSLDERARALLRDQLPQRHPWQRLLD